jgi:hypothetical protein
MDDFDITQSKDDPDFNDKWRIFATDEKLKPEQLPADTGLRRAYVNRLKEGKPVGTGFGVIVFDGEKIINKSV